MFFSSYVLHFLRLFMNTREIIPLKQKPNWTVTLPGSKSITNRAFLCAALAKGISRIYGALKSDDADVMLDSLAKLEVRNSKFENCITIEGRGGEFKKGDATLDLHNAGTATRFLTAAMILREGETLITGNQRMQERPIQDLVEGLRQLGGEIEYLGNDGCPPIRIHGMRGVNSVGTGHALSQPIRNTAYQVKMSGDKSSQYFSALLMLAPMLDKPMRLEVIGDLVSKPYIDTTIAVMKAFGVEVKNNSYQNFEVEPQVYQATEFYVEGDASGASYWTAIAKLHGGRVSFTNLDEESIQGDYGFAGVLDRCLCDDLEERTIDMNRMPDVAMTLAVCAPFFKGKTTIIGLSTLRIKETDRLAALEAELKKVGIIVETGEDFIVVNEMDRRRDVDVAPSASIKTYNDHRMAMCFAVLGTMIPGIVIEDPGCTDKTYPEFWTDLEKAYLSPIKLGEKNLVLIGMRGSGKSFHAKRLAPLLGRVFVDLDHEIELDQGMSIPEIIKKQGWDYFRNIEQEICSVFARQSNLIISTGGGAVLREENMKALRENGLILFVYGDPQVLADRVRNSHHNNRPSLTGEDPASEIQKVWEERRDLYLKYADLIWDDSSGEVVKEEYERTK
jgi:3-phosphoshikimate 1-carboxyvinyltransferase